MSVTWNGMLNEEDCEHCEHYHDWPMAEDQEEPYGDPGDGLGVQGFCCECPASHFNADGEPQP